MNLSDPRDALYERECPVCKPVDSSGKIANMEVAKSNPKHIRAQKDGKVPMDLIPWGPMAAVARVMAGGAAKYGVRNWRIDKILASTYEGAIARHALLEWAQGVDRDVDDGEHPLAHVIACCLLVMDAEANGTLIDDRKRAESLEPK